MPLIRPDHGRPDPTRKSEGLGTKIWPDGRVWVENKWPDFFGTGLGFGVWPEKVCVHDLHFKFVLYYV